MKKDSKITREHIKEAVNYFFNNKSIIEDTTFEHKRELLEVTDSKEYLCFKFSKGVATGIEGFKNLYKCHEELNDGETMEERFTEIVVNGNTLNNKQKKEFWNTLKKKKGVKN